MTARANLKKDTNNQAVQALSPNMSTLAVGSVASTTSNAALPAAAQLVRIAASTDCYIKFGTSNSVTATTSDMLFPTGAEVFVLDPSWTYVAFIRVSTDGVISIAEMR